MLATIGNLKVNYERSGTPGTALVFVHSLGADLTMYEPQAAALSADFDVIRYDLRGHGGSSLGNESPSLELLADDLGQLLDHLNVEAAHLVGQSIGAMVILALATKRTLSKHTLCLFDTIGWTDDSWNARYSARIAQIDASGMPGVAQAIAHTALGTTSKATRPEIETAYTARIRDCNPLGYSWCCKSMLGFDLRPNLSRVTCPVQLLAGEEDVVTPLRHLNELSTKLAHATVRAVPGAGHVPFIEIPDVASGLVREWAQCHPLGGARRTLEVE
jgi:pimeloyl-ACP methyl ester carboxylesterase